MNAILHRRSPAQTNRATHQSRKEKRGSAWHNPMELLTMATHALPLHALSSSHIANDAPAASTSLQPSLMRRAQREVDRILGPGALHRAFRAELPPER